MSANYVDGTMDIETVVKLPGFGRIERKNEKGETVGSVSLDIAVIVKGHCHKTIEIGIGDKWVSIDSAALIHAILACYPNALSPKGN